MRAHFGGRGKRGVRLATWFAGGGRTARSSTASTTPPGCADAPAMNPPKTAAANDAAPSLRFPMRRYASPTRARNSASRSHGRSGRSPKHAARDERAGELLAGRVCEETRVARLDHGSRLTEACSGLTFQSSPPWRSVATLRAAHIGHADRFQRLAPSDIRTAISRRRAMLRTSIRLATLAQASSRTKPEIVINMGSRVEKNRLAPNGLRHSGYAVTWSWPMPPATT